MIEQSFWVDISAEIILFYDNVLCSSTRKPWIWFNGRWNENHSPRLGFIWLVIETSIACYNYVCRPLADVNCGSFLRRTTII